jgi:hypothetical protein
MPRAIQTLAMSFVLGICSGCSDKTERYSCSSGFKLELRGDTMIVGCYVPAISIFCLTNSFASIDNKIRCSTKDRQYEIVDESSSKK